MNKVLLGVDTSSQHAKVVGPFGVDSYKLDISDAIVRKAVYSNEMKFEIDSFKTDDCFGSINYKRNNLDVLTESMNSHTTSKINVLIAIYQYLNQHCPHINHVSIVIGQSIQSQKNGEKNTIISLFEGNHEFMVNGVKKSIIIENVGVVPNGIGSFWSRPKMGEIRILDIGLDAINAATMNDKRSVYHESGTFNYGIGIISNHDDLNGMTYGIIKHTKALNWGKEDIVYICGEGAEQVSAYIQKHYEHAFKLKPLVNFQFEGEILEPIYANAVGFYEIAKRVFK